jgi:glutamate-1-semialdehyde aminotransferase
MEVAQSTFISSTFWSERIGPAAAIKTLEVMEREKSWQTITQIGSTINDGWTKLAIKYKLDLVLSGLPSLTSFSISSPNFLIFKTYLTQEMLKKNFLATTAVYASVAHDDSVINEYFSAIDPIFEKIKAFEKEASIDKYLEDPLCHSGFSRLN